MKKKYSILSISTFILSALLFMLFLVTYTLWRYDLQYQYPIVKILDSILIYPLVLAVLVFLISSFIGLIDLREPVLSIVIPMSICLSIIFIEFIIYASQNFTPTYLGECTITNYGIFEIPEKEYPDGTREYEILKRKVIENTDTINADIGTQYGFNFVIEGLPRTREITIKKIIKYPKKGLLESGKRKFSDTNYLPYSLGTLSFAGYNLSEEKYLMEGKWTYEYWYNEKLLLSKNFYVIVNKDEI